MMIVASLRSRSSITEHHLSLAFSKFFLSIKKKHQNSLSLVNSSYLHYFSSFLLTDSFESLVTDVKFFLSRKRRFVLMIFFFKIFMY